ncbi:TPA: hypothetical protein ACGGSM_003581 [Vibrio cholerae]
MIELKADMSMSEKGYLVQFDQVTRIIKRLAVYKPYVTCVDLEGRPIVPEKRGPDGGLDLIVRIEAETSDKEEIIEKEILAILINTDY